MMPGKQYFTVTDGVTGLPTWLWRVIETKIIVGSAAMAAVTGVGVAVGLRQGHGIARFQLGWRLAE
jgi:hypothetical protein